MMNNILEANSFHIRSQLRLYVAEYLQIISKWLLISTI